MKTKESQSKEENPKKQNAKPGTVSNILSYDVNIKKEKEYFIENFAMLIASGIDILSVIDAINTEIKSKQMLLIIADFKRDIESGDSIWEAVEKSKLLPKYMILLLKFGEESGRLDKNLSLVVKQQRKNRVLNSKIRSAMMYPALVMALSVIIGLGITWFILPNLSKVFTNMKIELPLITRMMLYLGQFLEKYGLVAVPCLCILIFGGFYLLFFHEKTKFVGQSLTLKIKVFRELIQNTEIAKFGFLLGSLLEAGMPIIVALDSIYEITGYVKYKKFYRFLKNSIDEGHSFQESLFLYPKLAEIIPITVQQLLISSEQSGQLAQVLLKIGDIYNDKIEDTSKNLTVLLEPVMLIIIWIGVVFLALAIILPIYSLIGGFNSSPEVTPKAPAPVIAPSSTPYPTIVLVEKPSKTLSILETSTGFLNVRSGPSLTGDVLTEVEPEEVYKYIAYENGWYEIVVSDELSGWVSEDFVIVN